MTRGRDAALDNLKGLLIISVVYVHLYDMLGQKTPLLFTIRTIVLAVQMPLFLFLCGYFGKHAEKRRMPRGQNISFRFCCLIRCIISCARNRSRGCSMCCFGRSICIGFC